VEVRSAPLFQKKEDVKFLQIVGWQAGFEYPIARYQIV
jgi:hypothetical protein